MQRDCIVQRREETVAVTVCNAPRQRGSAAHTLIESLRQIYKTDPAYQIIPTLHIRSYYILHIHFSRTDEPSRGSSA